jgi:hypothetical protein
MDYFKFKVNPGIFQAPGKAGGPNFGKNLMIIALLEPRNGEFLAKRGKEDKLPGRGAAAGSGGWPFG